MTDQAPSIEEASLNVLRLQPRVPLQNRLWTVPGSEHPEDVLRSQSMAPDDRLPAEYPRVDRDASKEFVLWQRLEMQGSSARMCPQGVYSVAQRGFGLQGFLGPRALLAAAGRARSFCSSSQAFQKNIDNLVILVISRDTERRVAQRVQCVHVRA